MMVYRSLVVGLLGAIVLLVAAPRPSQRPAAHATAVDSANPLALGDDGTGTGTVIGGGAGREGDGDADGRGAALGAAAGDGTVAQPATSPPPSVTKSALRAARHHVTGTC